jgi:hypothetical protein
LHDLTLMKSYPFERNERKFVGWKIERKINILLEDKPDVEINFHVGKCNEIFVIK